MKEVKVYWSSWSEFGRDSDDITHHLTGRWKIKNNIYPDTSPILYLEIKYPRLWKWFPQRLWLSEDIIRVNISESFINQCGVFNEVV